MMSGGGPLRRRGALGEGVGAEEVRPSVIRPNPTRSRSATGRGG